MMRTCGYIIVLTLTASFGALAQSRPSTIERARNLYYAAEYEQALAVLDTASVANTNDAVAVGVLSSAILLALGRSAEADRAFEMLVRLKPDLLPDQLGMTPWIVSRFAAVRARVLDEIQRQIRNETQRQGTLETRRTQPEFYTRGDAAVNPPIALRERVPEPPAIKGADYSGTILVLVDIGLNGSVERVSLDGSIDPRVDDLIRAAASGWLYRPAMLNGHPVRFRKAVRIDIR